MKLSEKLKKEADRQRGLLDYVVAEIMEGFADGAKELEALLGAEKFYTADLFNQLSQYEAKCTCGVKL